MEFESNAAHKLAKHLDLSTGGSGFNSNSSFFPPFHVSIDNARKNKVLDDDNY